VLLDNEKAPGAAAEDSAQREITIRRKSGGGCRGTLPVTSSRPTPAQAWAYHSRLIRCGVFPVLWISKFSVVPHLDNAPSPFACTSRDIGFSICLSTSAFLCFCFLGVLVCTEFADCLVLARNQEPVSNPKARYCTFAATLACASFEPKETLGKLQPLCLFFAARPSSAAALRSSYFAPTSLVSALAKGW